MAPSWLIGGGDTLDFILFDLVGQTSVGCFIPIDLASCDKNLLVLYVADGEVLSFFLNKGDLLFYGLVKVFDPSVPPDDKRFLRYDVEVIQDENRLVISESHTLVLELLNALSKAIVAVKRVALIVSKAGRLWFYDHMLGCCAIDCNDDIICSSGQSLFNLQAIVLCPELDAVELAL